MNIELTPMSDADTIACVRCDNDNFRQGAAGGALMLSAGIVALGAGSQHRVLAAVRRFDDFDDDDITDLHDAGDLDVAVDSPGSGGEPVPEPAKPTLIFFRIDRAACLGGTRVLSVMLATEW
jgi:hypothetical protein